MTTGERVVKLYVQGRISLDGLNKALEDGTITREQYDEAIKLRG